MDHQSIAPGFYPEMTNDEYHAAPGISKSHLDQIDITPAHYFARYLDPSREEEEKTPALILGDAIHKAVLEPDLFESRFVARPKGIDGRTNAGKAQLAALFADAGDRTVLGTDDYKTAIAVRDSVHRHPLASGLFRDGLAEATFFAKDARTGALVKCKPDFYRSQFSMIVDLKTTESASLENFARSAGRYLYDVQAAWYPDVIESLYGEVIETFVFVAVEKSPPYAVGVYYLEPEDVQIGREIAHRNLDKILKCREANVWPDYAGMAGAQPLRIPGYMRRTT
ncbi:PD-(D/E)XK nuclease-like domain-containing protein [Parvibaculum sp.]|uniref:PD-(D/E)XK nuclease-like domain-containing protein n=1 Tax=Parvibaculum sp. TaxID=2024848 RepID=UPI0027348EDC|nr:PD-(D/E)XK nuclease-like domain-containing protein [Parvibaculum sp.]MDP3328760.1 PD-(D/E)XK nuclease-like domain-containing protein [Parvibaculum sp.]